MCDEMNGFLPYNILYREGSGEVVSKRSRFIAQACPVKTEEEAFARIELTKKKYMDARHHCYAFIIGRNAELIRYSDDGEPGGCAGKPILEVLNGEAVTDVILIVTRYFGGTLLGTGGLVRAYTQAAREGLFDAEIVKMRYGTRLLLTVDYGDTGKVQYLLARWKAKILEQVFTEKVSITVKLPAEEVKGLKAELMEVTGARAGIKILNNGYDIFVDK